MRVLIVAATPLTSFVIQKSLTSFGAYDVTFAQNNSEACQEMHRSRPDLVLSDWNRSGRETLELLREFKQIDQDVPFIVITDENHRSQFVEARHLGADDYLIQPFSPSQFQQKLQKWASHHQSLVRSC